MNKSPFQILTENLKEKFDMIDSEIKYFKEFEARQTFVTQRLESSFESVLLNSDLTQAIVTAEQNKNKIKQIAEILLDISRDCDVSTETIYKIRSIETKTTEEAKTTKETEEVTMRKIIPNPHAFQKHGF